MNSEKLSVPFLLNSSDLTTEDIRKIFDKTDYFNEHFKPGVKFDDLKAVTIAMAFFETSTRTKLSFDIAAKRLSADTITFQSSSKKDNKAESLIDTFQTIEALGADMFVVRHPKSGVPHFWQNNTKGVVINAGDGIHEHPTQALIDAYTLYTHFGQVDKLKVCIVGDIINSRIAHSNITLLKTLGADVRLCAPGTLLPRYMNIWDCKIIDNIEDAIGWADALFVLRLRSERIESGIIPSLREFSAYYGISYKRFITRPDLVLLHPGPVNYGVEIDYKVSGFPNCLIQNQVTYGVFVRMALLSLLAKHLKNIG